MLTINQINALLQCFVACAGMAVVLVLVWEFLKLIGAFIRAKL